MKRIALAVAVLLGVGGVWLAAANNGGSTAGGSGTAAPTTSATSATGRPDTTTTTMMNMPKADDRGFSALENGSGMKMDMSEQPIATLAKGTQAELRRQLWLTLDVVKRLATVKDAEAAGYRRAGPFSPGLGTHYVLQDGRGLNPDGVMDDQDILTPLSVIYDGSAPDSPVVGLMYYSMSPKRPTGFAGPNDTWHIHKNICTVRAADGKIDTPLGADRETTDAQCAAVGGALIKQTQWMLHVWTVPSYTSPQGVFSPLNAAITCTDGTFYERPADQWGSKPLNACRNA